MDLPGVFPSTLTAPTSGATEGIVILGNQTMPRSTATSVGTQFTVGGGATLNNLSTERSTYQEDFLTFFGGRPASSSCQLFIANTIDLKGCGTFKNNCSGYNVQPIGAVTAAISQLGAVKSHV